MIRRNRRNGFSLLEVIAAAVILTVVTTATLATVVPMRVKADHREYEQQLAALNSMSQTYLLEVGTFPPHGITSLISIGYLANGDTEAKGRNARMKSSFAYNRATGTFSKR